MTRYWVVSRNRKTGKKTGRKFIGSGSEKQVKSWARGYNQGKGGQNDRVELVAVGGKQHLHHKRPRRESSPFSFGNGLKFKW